MKNVDKIAEIIRKYWPNATLTIDKSDIDVNFHSGTHVAIKTQVEGKWIRVSFANHWVKVPTNPKYHWFPICEEELKRSLSNYKENYETKRSGRLTVGRLKDMVGKNVRVSSSRGRVAFSVPADKAEKVAKLLAKV